MRMAAAVEEALVTGDHLLVEAGTGVGKTLAYLIPAARLGERVVISTGTLNLQDQIFFRDLPLLRQRLGLKLRAAYLKGRDNYLCLHRLRQVEHQPPLADPVEASAFQQVRAWAGRTERGDRGELASLPEGLGFWREINARADTCLGRKCPDYDDCFLVRTRQVAAEADLVVVNHHLLLADLVVKAGDFGAILPEYRHVILDEAHLLEDVATSYFGRTVSFSRCRELADDVDKLITAAGADPTTTAPAAAARLHATELFATFRERVSGRERLRAELWTAARSNSRARLLAALDELAAALGAAHDASDDLLNARRRAQETAADLRFITLADDPDHVRWVEAGARGASLHAAPIDVAAPLREHLFGKAAAVVLTSATLTVGGEFDFIRTRLGLDDARTLAVPSPFDYERQAFLYLPPDLPEPDAPDYAEKTAARVRELLAITGGRAFLLFTSYAGLRRMQEQLDAAPHDYNVLVQGQGARHALLERFRSERRSVLLATASFWQGVDVPGEALSLVVIDRLPFEVPSDPVVEARIDRMRRNGENPFRDYQLPAAVIGLKQGVGRLIRTGRDRGVLAVLDARLRTRAYGKVFLDSLPPFARGSDLEEVRRFWAGA